MGQPDAPIRPDPPAEGAIESEHTRPPAAHAGGHRARASPEHGPHQTVTHKPARDRATIVVLTQAAIINIPSLAGCLRGRLCPAPPWQGGDQALLQPPLPPGRSGAGPQSPRRADVRPHRPRAGSGRRGVADESARRAGQGGRGCLTRWHQHESLCSADPAKGLITGVRRRDGSCPAGQVLWRAPAMLHTWVIDVPAARSPTPTTVGPGPVQPGRVRGAGRATAPRL
jgi:hypothetical protein